MEGGLVHGGMGLGIIIINIMVRVRIGQALRADFPMIIKLSCGSESYHAILYR